MIQHSDTPLSVIHICTERTLRGGERQCLLLHEKLLERGHNSFIACRSNSILSSQCYGNIVPIFSSNVYNPSSLIQLHTICKKYSNPLIHTHDSKALAIGALYSSFSKTPKIIYSRKSLFPIRNTILNRYKYSRISQIIAISNAVARIYSDIKVKVPVCIIHDAVPITNSGLLRDDIRKQFGLKPEDFCIGSVAFFTREKNLPLLLKCADYLEKTTSSIKILLIGPIEPSLEPEIKARKSIIATGYLQEATQYYPAFDAYISTSSSEGLGSALIDAIVRDVPSVAMDAGGTRDCFGDFSTPASTEEELLTQLGNIIADHSTARSNASKLGVWARSEFNVENFVNKHIAIYNNIRQEMTGK